MHEQRVRESFGCRVQANGRPSVNAPFGCSNAEGHWSTREDSPVGSGTVCCRRAIIVKRSIAV